MGCLYYIPARRFEDARIPDTIKGEALAGLGLGHLQGASLTYRGVRNSGPDGGAGLVLGVNTPASETGVWLSEQTWQPANGGDVFIGWKTDAKPGPDSFLRANALPAKTEVVMGDGNPWGFVVTSALPMVMCLDSAGEIDWKSRPSDAAHFAASEWLFDYLCGGERTYVDIVANVATCMASRYAISPIEIMALELFSTDLNAEICCACTGIDYDEYTGKKNTDPAPTD